LKNQELQQSDDEYLKLVDNNDPERLQASYGRLIPVMVKAIQELQEEIKNLKNK
jgi:HPt (histidine-containing phosphotransfer) domain-containing protein